jgi:hypothetical protein
VGESIHKHSDNWVKIATEKAARVAGPLLKAWQKPAHSGTDLFKPNKLRP